ncbi:hypothetical protein [Lysinibacillus sp. LZ02]|uniref:hypothetical protein n=1 Tax=Lysinibacillus sp. LZ02 TaxID=3420668 RepID=UPI003D35CE4D
MNVTHLITGALVGSLMFPSFFDSGKHSVAPIVCKGPEKISQSNEELPYQATWIWHAESLEKNTDQYLQFIEEKQIAKVYVQVNAEVKNEVYAAFIQKANHIGVQVYALDGNPDWGTNTQSVERFKEWVTTFQREYGLLEGVHLDIEPYTLDMWQTNQRRVIVDFFHVLNGLKAFAATEKLEYEVTIPFWFDEVSYKNRFGKGVVSEYIIDLADRVSVMAYRNEACGKEGIIALSATEIKYAQSKGKSVMIAVETFNTSEGDFLTFYGKDEAYMNKELTKVYKRFENREGFDGFAIHYLDTWMLRSD